MVTAFCEKTVIIFILTYDKMEKIKRNSRRRNRHKPKFLGIHDSIWEYDERLQLESYTLIDNENQLLSLLLNSYFSPGKINPDYVYVSIGSAPDPTVPMRDKNIFQIIPVFFMPLTDPLNELNALCIMIDEVSEYHKQDVKNKIKKYIKETYGKSVYVIHINKNCIEELVNPLIEHTQKYASWNTCVSYMLKSVLSYLNLININPERCLFANFVKFTCIDIDNKNIYT